MGADLERCVDEVTTSAPGDAYSQFFNVTRYHPFGFRPADSRECQPILMTAIGHQRRRSACQEESGGLHSSDAPWLAQWIIAPRNPPCASGHTNREGKVNAKGIGEELRAAGLVAYGNNQYAVPNFGHYRHAYRAWRL